MSTSLHLDAPDKYDARIKTDARMPVDWDPDELAVAADCLEEHGFEHVAYLLRSMREAYYVNETVTEGWACPQGRLFHYYKPEQIFYDDDDPGQMEMAPLCQGVVRRHINLRVRYTVQSHDICQRCWRIYSREKS